MTEQEAKTLAAELEHNKYWRVTSISAPYEMRGYVVDADGNSLINSPIADEWHVTVRIQHRTANHGFTCSGIISTASLMRDLIEDGPKYANE